MLATSTSPHSGAGAGGLTLLFAFVVAPLIVILAIALEALSDPLRGRLFSWP